MDVDQRIKDITIIYYTANTLREPFATNARKQLVKASRGIPITSVSQKPLDLGQNICVGDIGRSYLNIYRQMLVGAKEAKTKYIAMAEDDVLYSFRHFVDFRPNDDEFAYDMSRWSIYTWTKPPLYSIKYRRSNTTLLCPRDLFIEAMEERFRRWPDDSKVNLGVWSEPGKYERKLGVTKRKSVEYSSQVPCIVFSHEDAIGYDYQGKSKAVGFLKAYDIPVWGTAEHVLNYYYLGVEKNETKKR